MPKFCSIFNISGLLCHKILLNKTSLLRQKFVEMIPGVGYAWFLVLVVSLLTVSRCSSCWAVMLNYRHRIKTWFTVICIKTYSRPKTSQWSPPHLIPCQTLRHYTERAQWRLGSYNQASPDLLAPTHTLHIMPQNVIYRKSLSHKSIQNIPSLCVTSVLTEAITTIL